MFIVHARIVNEIARVRRIQQPILNMYVEYLIMALDDRVNNTSGQDSGPSDM